MKRINILGIIIAFIVGVICATLIESLYYSSYDYTMEQLKYVNGYVKYTESQISEMNSEISSLDKKISDIRSISNPTLFDKDKLTSLETEKQSLEMKLTQMKKDLEFAKEKANSLAQKVSDMIGA